MKGLVLTFAFVMAIASLARSGVSDDPAMAAVPTHNAGQLIAGPELEIATDTSAIIRWTTGKARREESNLCTSFGQSPTLVSALLADIQSGFLEDPDIAMISRLIIQWKELTIKPSEATSITAVAIQPMTHK